MLHRITITKIHFFLSLLFIHKEMKLLEIERVLALREQEDRVLKQENTKSLKESWDDSIKHKNAQLSEYQDNKKAFAHTSLSGAQPMTGEDQGRNIRIKMQQEEMRNNIKKSLEERDDMKKKNDQIELQYSEMDQYLYKMKTQAEIDEFLARRQTNIEVRQQNSEVTR